MASRARARGKGREASPPEPPKVVAIGASADGIEALQIFFEHLPDDLGLSYVIVLHLAPEARSELPHILRGRTTMPVEAVDQATALQPNRVYVIPPDRRLTVTNGKIVAEPFNEPRGRRLPIDHLFRSLSAAASDSFAVEAANEELRAANEELQSVNEEYRSTSEELETSKEELQSVNEELQTVNTELKLKLDGVSRANSDLQNLMAATDVGTLFLDPAMRIKLFTPTLAGLFSVTANDEGRPITDFTHQLRYDGLADDVATVLRDLNPVEREVQSQAGAWFLMRVRPYRTLDDKIDGVVITFVDITERRRTEEALRRSEERLRQEMRLVDLSHAPIFAWDLDDGVVQWNRGSEQLYGYRREAALGQRKHLMLKTEVPGSNFDALIQTLIEQGQWNGELHQRARDGRRLVVESQLELVQINGRRLVLESTHDVTERRSWERRQEMMLAELSHRVKNTLAVVQSFASQSVRGAATPEEFIERFEGRLSALAKSHQLLVDPWQGADVEALAREQLEPYLGGRPEKLRLEGEAVRLPPDLAVPLGLVLHELATNAIKHGAWSDPKGRVDVRWTNSGRGARRMLTLIWRESAGPLVSAPTSSGFGSRLIERGLPNSKVQREFKPDGAVCTIEVRLPEESGA